MKSGNDPIKNSIPAQERQGQPPEPLPIPAENKGKNNGHQKAPNPEKLKFLKPCPICGGRDFIHGHEGGFFCISCQPGIEGLPVLALGYRNPPEKAKGLPCPNCGATIYGKEEKGFLLPDGTVTDGWHCGGASCRVKLLIGATVDRHLKTNRPGSRRALLSPDSGDQCFKAAFPWVQDHLQKLLAAGWTRPELFRRDRCAWPLRKWGLCWLPIWKKTNVKIKIEDSGQLIFSFTGVDGRRIEQTAFPQHTAKNIHPVEQQLCCSAT